MMNLGFICMISLTFQLMDGKNSFFSFEIGKSLMIAISSSKDKKQERPKPQFLRQSMMVLVCKSID
jgi:hypothetical protein